MFDPEVLQILGLNLLAQKSPNTGVGLGNAGLATMEWQRQKEEDKYRKEEREFLKQQRELQMAQMRRQQQFQDALSQGFRPGIAADPLTPMDDEGNPMPSSRPTMDFSRAMQIDPFAAMQAQAQFQSFNKPRAPISVKEGETLVNPDNFQPLFQNAKPKDAFQMLPPAEARALGLPPDQSYQRNSKTGKIDAIGRQQITVTTNVPGEDSFAKAFGSNVAGQMAETLKAGQEAPAQVNVSRRVKQLLDSGAITGPGAEQLTTVASALASTGIVAGTTAEERIANTQLLASSLARQTLSAIRGSGLGTGQGFTDKDRQFLERAASGNITLNATALKELANLNERSAIAAIRKHNDIVKRMRGNPGLGSVGSMYEELPLPSNAGYTVTNY